MRILEVVRKSHAPTPALLFVPILVASTASLLMILTHSLLGSSVFVLESFGTLYDAGLWIAGCVALLLWWVAFALGRVGGGTSAGFVLVLFGLVCRVRGTWSALMLGDVVPDVPSVRAVLTLSAFHRNAGLVAFGLGLGLVAASSAADVVRRRRAPYWTRPEA